VAQVSPDFQTAVKAGASIYSYQFMPRGAGLYQVQIELIKGSVLWREASGKADAQPQYLQAAASSKN